MKRDLKHTEKFLKGLTSITGLPYKKVQQYVKGNNPFNILEHPRVLDPNEKQLKKIGLLNEFIASYNVLKICESNEKIKFNSATVVGQFFSAILGGIKDKERFMIAFLDSGNNVIEIKTMSEGTIGQTAVYPREVLKYALACDCKSMILAHNHPGGSDNFSPEDRVLTQRIVDIFYPLEIKVLDHIIVCGNIYSSMAERGEMPLQHKSSANYDVIRFGTISAEETRIRHQYIR